MISATRRWFRRNRTPLAIGVGVVGAGYLATNYVLNKINDARERMSSDRIAKENLRRRFEQNQEDCTFTVLALLPTATANVLDAMNTENITLEIQQMKGSAKPTPSRSSPAATATAATATANPNAAESSSTPAAAPALAPAPSIADTAMTEEEGKSTAGSFQSDGGVHVSQMAVPSPSAAGGEGITQDGGNQTPPKPKKTKRQLWDELTISSITRVFTLIYTLALLTLLTRIQLNLLGRRSYLSSVVSLATGAAQSTINLENNDDDNPEQAAAYYGSDFETNRKYLTFSWWLLNRGWVDVMERVEQAVRDVFGRLSPRDLLSFDTFSQLTLEVRKKVESGGPATASTPPSVGGSGQASSSPWLSFLLPPSTLEDFVLRESGVLGDSAAAATADHSGGGGGAGSVSGSTTVVSSSSTTAPQSPTPASLRRLLDETSDLIESPTFGHVLTQLLDAGFSHLLNHKVLPDAFEAAAGPPSISPSISITAPSSVISMSEANAGTGTPEKNVVMLPKILSVLTRQAHAVGSGGGVTNTNDFLGEMELVPDLEAFAAVVYSSNWENEIQRQDGNGYGHSQAATGMEGSFVSVAGESSTIVGGGGGGGPDESMVLVDYSASQPSQQEDSQMGQSQSSFESAWEKATGRR